MITIKNYSSDMNYGVFFNWDMKFAMESEIFYSFEFEHRVEGKRVYVLVNREASSDGFHEVYIQDMKDQWKKTVHLAPNHLNKSAFYNWVESVIDDEYGLPF
jgi:hypothetical protein